MPSRSPVNDVGSHMFNGRAVTGERTAWAPTTRNVCDIRTRGTGGSSVLVPEGLTEPDRAGPGDAAARDYNPGRQTDARSRVDVAW